MKIGIFSDTYYPEINGVVTSIRILEKEMMKRGHQVYIFTTSHPDARRNDTNVFRLPSIPLVFLPSRRMGTVYWPNAAKVVRRLKLDIIHTQTEFSLGTFGKLMARQLGIPVVHTYHTMYKDYVHYISRGKLIKLAKGLAKKVSKGFCDNCNAIIAPTQKVEDLLKEYGVSQSIYIIPTGIDIEPFKKDKYDPNEIKQLRGKLGIGDDEKVVLFIGRIAREKSVDVIINQMPELIKKLPNTKLLLVGDGPTRKEMIQLCKKINCENAVVFAGEQPWDTIGKFYQIGDVFVSASVTETQGLTFTEAMAAQIPVVAKQDKSIEGIIQDQRTGRIFEKDEELADVLYDVLTNTDRTRQIVENAYDAVDLVSSDHFGRKVEEVYFNVLNEVSQMKTTINL